MNEIREILEIVFQEMENKCMRASTELQRKRKKENIEIFYKRYGLRKRYKYSVKYLAKEFNLSEGRIYDITNTLKKRCCRRAAYKMIKAKNEN